MNEYADLVRDVQKLKTDVWYGDGKDNPSVTTRLALIEKGDEMTTAKLEAYDKLLTKAVIASFGSAIAVIAFLIKAIFFPHAG